MPRRPNPFASEHIHITLPAELKQRIELLLHSTSEGKVPQGVWQTFWTERLREFFDYSTLDLAPFGFPPGFFVRAPKGMIEALRRKLEEQR